MRDIGDEEWSTGFVSTVEPELRVKREGEPYDNGWDEVLPFRTAAKLLYFTKASDQEPRGTLRLADADSCSLGVFSQQELLIVMNDKTMIKLKAETETEAAGWATAINDAIGTQTTKAEAEAGAGAGAGAGA
jgi:hypothetical protein